MGGTAEDQVRVASTEELEERAGGVAHHHRREVDETVAALLRLLLLHDVQQLKPLIVTLLAGVEPNLTTDTTETLQRQLLLAFGCLHLRQSMRRKPILEPIAAGRCRTLAPSEKK